MSWGMCLYMCLYMSRLRCGTCALRAVRRAHVVRVDVGVYGWTRSSLHTRTGSPVVNGAAPGMGGGRGRRVAGGRGPRSLVRAACVCEGLPRARPCRKEQA